MLQEVQIKARELGPAEFNEDDDDNALTFEYFLAVNKVSVTFAYKQIED